MRQTNSDIFKIRNAKITDSLSISNLLNELGYPISNDLLVGNLSSSFSDTRQCIIICENELSIVGIIQVVPNLFIGSSKSAEIACLVISKNFHRMGIGKTLINEAVKFCADRYDTLFVRSATKRLEAHQFYEKMNFAFKKSQNVYVLQKGLA